MDSILERGEGGDGETTVIIQGEVMGWSQTPAGSLRSGTTRYICWGVETTGCADGLNVGRRTK